MAFLDFPLCNYFSVDTEPGGKELVGAQRSANEVMVGICSWIFHYIIISMWIRNLVGKNWWRKVFLDFLLCNYFSADTEPGGKELVAHSVPGFSSV